MNPRRTVALLAITVVLMLAGCKTPTQQWAAQRETLTTVTSGLTAAARAGALNDEQIITADVFVQAARRGIEVAESYLPNGGSAFDSYLAAVDTAIIKVGEIYQRKSR